jgi:hypothetical protein
VDEGDVFSVIGLYLLRDIDHGTADAALAQLRGREQEDHRFLAQHVGEIMLVHRARGVAGVDLGEVATDLVSGGSVDARGLVPGPRNFRELADDRAGHDRCLEAVPVPRQRADSPLAILVELDLGDVDNTRGVWIVGRRLRLVGGIGLQAFHSRRIRALGLAARSVGDVDRDLRVGDLLAPGREDAEAEAVLSLVEDLDGRGNDRTLGVGLPQYLLEGAAVRGREARRLGSRPFDGGLVVRASAGRKGEGARG